jgi:hypothetical protein
MLRIGLLMLVSVCVTLVPHSAAVAQNASTPVVFVLSPPAAKVKKQVEQLGLNREVTAIMLDGREFHGSIKVIDADRFTLAEVDLKRLVDFRYDDTKKLLKGYGGFGANGQRAHLRRSLWIGLAVVGGLIGLVFGVAANTR